MPRLKRLHIDLSLSGNGNGVQCGGKNKKEEKFRFVLSSYADSFWKTGRKIPRNKRGTAGGGRKPKKKGGHIRRKQPAVTTPRNVELVNSYDICKPGNTNKINMEILTDYLLQMR